ncbi:hypothetical protein [Phytohabitans rumicis]|uniref:Uncharacterized protein n=2 Tax=Phytohabitans rumicis TaxID=1076125 RepID=A0A6V8LGU1_9ACTN|nr:hypothetical protein [Phytohabitans rumicis]GFJ91845.1 hypothetical protein Prum_054870 [Phytohabitans rumicis]
MQEGLRQQAEVQQHQAADRTSQAEARRQYAENAAHQHDQAARAHEQRANQHEQSYQQRADRAANTHDQEAARAQAEANQHKQQAQQHAQNDPLRQLEERRAQHHQEVADRARTAADQYRGARDRQQSALVHDHRADQHAQQAAQHRQQAAAHDQAAHAAEQRRAAAENAHNQWSKVDPKVADQHRATADQHASDRDAAQARATAERQAAHASEQAAAAERAAAAADRTTRDAFHDAAESWHRSLGHERLQDPGTPAPEGGPRPFRPEDLPDGLRARYEALQDPRAREQFEQMYERMGGNERHLTGALDGIERRAHANDGTLEQALVDKYEQTQQEQAAEQAIQPPSPEILREINNQLDHLDDLRGRIEAYAREHPEVRGTERWLKTLNSEANSLREEARGLHDPSVQRAQDHGNNVRGIEGEVELAARSHGVTEVGLKVKVTTPDGKTYKTDVDVVAEGGRVWKDSKNYNWFPKDSTTFDHLKEQVTRQLRILAFDTAHHVDGQPPRLEWHFSRGVNPEVARALEAIRIVDPVTGLDLPHRVTVVDGTAGGPPPHSPTPDSPPPDSTPPDSTPPDAPGSAHGDPPSNMPHEWPSDPVNGYVIHDRDLDFLGLTREDVELWMAREAPLGMTPELYREWRTSLLDALQRDGISPEHVDIRLRGSAADFFSGVHKQLPTHGDLAGNLDAAQRLRDWIGDDPSRPTSRPFDSMHRLGLEEPSDYDINISSGSMFEHAAAQWVPGEHAGPLTKDHGYLNKALVRNAFPHLAEWADAWTARTGRDMSYAVFDHMGPADMSHLGFNVHFRESDWVVQHPPEHPTDQPTPAPEPPPADAPGGAHPPEPPGGDPPGTAFAEPGGPDPIKALIDAEVGPHSPELASVINKLLDDPHPLNLTKYLEDPATRDAVVRILAEIGEGAALRPHDGSLAEFLAEHQGRGPLFDPPPRDANYTTRPDGTESSRLHDYVDAAKQQDPALRVGREPTPEQRAQVDEYAARLKHDVEPAVREELSRIADDLRRELGGQVEVNSRAKDGDGLIDKVQRMTAGREGAPGRLGYEVGNVIDAVGARITVDSMQALEGLYDRIVARFGVGDGGRIIEIENMYAEPKAKNPAYRVIPMVVSIEVGGRPYTFELQLTTLRASVAADLEHNSIYKPYVSASAAEQDAVREALREAAALDQLEAGRD